VTSAAHMPGACPPSSEAVARIRATVHGPQIAEVARVANFGCLDNPSQRFLGADLDAGDYSFSYTPAATPARKYLRVTVWIYPGSAVGLATITLTIRDSLGNSVTGAVSTMPLGFRGENRGAPPPAYATRHETALRVAGDFDLAALAATLTGPDWSWDFALTSTNSAYFTVEAFELPRVKIDTAETYGALPVAYLGGAEIDDDAATGTERLLTTIAGARTTERVYLQLAWEKDTSAPIPQTTGTAFAFLTNLDENGTTYETWRVFVRQVYAVSTAGEAAKVRFLYRLSGGAGTETAEIRTHTGSTASPFDLTGLAHTGTSWVWSDWKTILLDTAGATAGQEGTTTIGFEARVSAAGPTLYLAAIEVLEDVA
jgi:hypothetical protein